MMRQHGNWVENHPAKSGANHSTKYSVTRFLRRLSDDSVNHSARNTEHHPGDSSHHPESRVLHRLHSRTYAEVNPNVENHVRDHIEDESQHDAQKQSKAGTRQGLKHRAL